MCFTKKFVFNFYRQSMERGWPPPEMTGQSAKLRGRIISQGCLNPPMMGAGRIKALPLRQQNDCFGDKCGMASAATSAGYCCSCNGRPQ